MAARRPLTAPLRDEVALFCMDQLCHSPTMASETMQATVPPAGFGRRFTGHMAVATFTVERGWSPLDLVPFDDLRLSPAAMVFHYGQAIFEGLKAFRQPDGGVALFRPSDNAARFNRSGARLAMPAIPVELFVRACTDLVASDRHWVPGETGTSLYLRPMMIATEIGLGVRAADEYLFTVIASPVGAYFEGELHPISLWASVDYVRATPGGTGFAKCGGNYGASLAAKQDAVAHGYDETLWLDALDHRWIEEMGGMNIAFVDARGERPCIVTPPIGDTILDGVTRRSILELAPRLGYDVVERPVSIEELGPSGPFSEAFACGTAAVIVPISRVHSHVGDVLVGDGQPGSVTMHLREALIAVQEGRARDHWGWLVHVAPPLVD
jgi:branched-chain amino acid aminotransferase